MLRLKKKAFTLIELIVVIVILGLLAALAVPTFKGVIDRAKMETDIASLSAQARSQIANAAFNQGTFDSATIEAAIAETSGWVPTASAPTKFGEINYAISGDTLSMVTRSSDGNFCLTSVIAGTTVNTFSAPYASGSCLASDIPVVPEIPGGGETTPPTTEPTPDPEETEEPPVEEVVLPSPSGFTYAQNRSATQVSLGWAAVPGATSYEVSLLNGTPKVVQGNSTTFPAQPSTSYTYTVKALGNNAASEVVTTSQYQTRLPGPVLNASQSGSPMEGNVLPVYLSWQNVPGAARYNVYVNNELYTTTDVQRPTELDIFLAPGDFYVVVGVSTSGVEGNDSNTVYNEDGQVLRTAWSDDVLPY